jgi:hypothetical protein
MQWPTPPQVKRSNQGDLTLLVGDIFFAQNMDGLREATSDILEVWITPSQVYLNIEYILAS